MKEIKTENNTIIPDHEVEALARCFLPHIRDYFESEEGQNEFEEWLRNQTSVKCNPEEN